MAIHFSCGCGKRLRVEEQFQGRRIRWASCGEVSVVPPEAQEQRTVPPPSPQTVDGEDGPDEARDVSRPRPRARRKKKQKKERSRAEAGQIEIFGIPLTLKTGVVAACVLLLVAGVVYFFISLDRCKVVEARRVDVYAALDVANRNMAKEILGMQSSRILKPGSQTFVIIHDSPQGQAVLVHVKLPPKFLMRRTNPTHGSLVITGKDFLLQGDGPPVEALLLDLDRDFSDPSKGVTMDFSSAVDGAPVLPRDRFLIESLEVICLFPRPSGKDLTLTVLGERVGAVRPK